MHILDITIDHTKVAADLDNFPVLIVPANSVDWDALYAVATGSGGDIRVYKAGGSVELPREVVSFSIAGKTGEIHVKYSGTLSSTVNTVIELHADGTSADYAVGATYGRNAVWSTEYEAVWHLNETTGSRIDSTGRHNLTDNNTVGSVAGKLGTSANFNGIDEWLNKNPLSLALNYSVDFWVNERARVSNANDALTNIIYYSNTDFSEITLNNGELKWAGAGNAWRSTGVIVTLQTWTKISVTNALNDLKLYKDGVSAYTTTTDYLDPMANNFNLAVWDNGTTRVGYSEIYLDEFRLRKSVKTAAQEKTEYNNQSDVGTFWGTVTDVGGAASTGFMAFM